MALYTVVRIQRPQRRGHRSKTLKKVRESDNRMSGERTPSAEETAKQSPETGACLVCSSSSTKRPGAWSRVRKGQRKHRSERRKGALTCSLREQEP